MILWMSPLWRHNQIIIQVSQALENELAKIDSLIADFVGEFHPTKTDEYRQKLIKHVETGFRRNLVSYCSESLVNNVCQEKELGNNLMLVI